MNDGRIALVTGSNRGIGLEIVHQLTDRGYRVILTSRDRVKGEEAMKTLASKEGQVTFHVLDVTSVSSIQKAANYVTDTFGRLDVLINNAGINYDRWHQAFNADLDEVRQTMEANLFGPWQMILSFLPLLKQGHSPRIINISSQAGQFASLAGGTPGYGLSKISLNALTLKLAQELKDTGILVNSMCPGWVRTQMGGEEAPRSVQEGADTAVWLAEAPDDSATGKFFTDRKEIPW